jgi:hypothetical protein
MIRKNHRLRLSDSVVLAGHSARHDPSKPLDLPIDNVAARPWLPLTGHARWISFAMFNTDRDIVRTMMWISRAAILAGTITVLCLLGIAPASAVRVLMPPKNFDHPYHGKMDIRTHSVLVAVLQCFAKACSWKEQSRCVVIMPDELDKALWKDFIRHEQAHCNGWPADHPGGWWPK